MQTITDSEKHSKTSAPSVTNFNGWATIGILYTGVPAGLAIAIISLVLKIEVGVVSGAFLISGAMGQVGSLCSPHKQGGKRQDDDEVWDEIKEINIQQTQVQSELRGLKQQIQMPNRFSAS